MSNRLETHFEGKIAQKAIIVKDGLVLLVRDPRSERAIWEIPGGRLNVDEEPRKGLARELYEEIGAHCTIHEVIHMQQFLQGSEKKTAFVIVYRASLQEENAPFVLDDTEVVETRWISKDDLQTIELFPEYARALEIFFNMHRTT